MADKATYSALQKKAVTIPAHSVATVDYIDTQPNYFRVQNSGKSILYCSTANIPTENQHDFSVNPASMKMFAEPFNRSKLYILNPSGNAVNVSVMSFRAEFDPISLALTDMAIDLDGVTFEAGNTITSFSVPLPAGGNEIGKVQVSSLPVLPTGGNHVGSVDVDNLKDYSTVLSSILAAAGNIKDYTATLANILAAIGNINSAVESSMVVFNCIETTATNAGKNILTLTGATNAAKIHYISNDGDADITVSIKSADSIRMVSMTVKAGEVIDHIEGNFDMLMVAGNDVPFRMAVSVYPSAEGGED